jgi:hypothetical protein
MAENNDPPRQSQPFLDILNKLKREPLSPRQQAELAKLHAHLQQNSADLNRLRDMLSMPPEEAERWKQRWKGRPSVSLFDEIQKAYEQWQLQQQASEPNEPAPEPAPESVIESAVNKIAEQVAPIKRKRPKQWKAEWMKTNPQRKGEKPGKYGRRMHADMKKAPDVTAVWKLKTCLRELYRTPKEVDFEPDPSSLQAFPKHH